MKNTNDSDIKFGKIYKLVNYQQRKMPYEHIVPIETLKNRYTEFIVCLVVDKDKEYILSKKELLSMYEAIDDIRNPAWKDLQI